MNMPKPEQAVDYFTTMQAQAGWMNILESFARFVAPKAGMRVLDVGTGPGALAAHFQTHYQVVAVGADADKHMMQRANILHSGSGVSFVTASLPKLPFRDCVFDVVCASNVLYLLDEPNAALQEIVRVLSANGTFAMLNPSPMMSYETAKILADERQMTDFARENFLHWGTVAEQHSRWSETEIEQWFATNGLELVKAQRKIGAGLALYVQGVKI